MKTTQMESRLLVGITVLISAFGSILSFSLGCARVSHHQSARVVYVFPPSGEVRLTEPKVITTEVKVPSFPVAPDLSNETAQLGLKTKYTPVFSDTQQQYEVVKNSLMTVAVKLQGLMRDTGEIEVWSLVPELVPELISGNEDAKSAFRGFNVSGHANITDPDVTKRLLYYLALAVANGPEESADCFMPRHAFRVRSADRVVDIIVCFECGNGEMYDGDDYYWFTISADEEPMIDVIFDECGLKKMK